MLKNRILLLLMVLMLAFTVCAAGETALPAPTPEPQKIPLSVNGYELTYDDIMREGIGYELPQDEFSISENAVIFTKLMEETAHPLFTMYVYSNEGDTHTVIRNEAGDIIPISFVYAPVPENLPPESRQLFQLDAEEAVNMLIATLQVHQVPTGQEQSAEDAQTVIALQDYQISFNVHSKARLQITAEGNQAQFLLALADGSTLPAFTLDCGSEQGSIVIRQTDDTGAQVPIAFTMLSPSEELDEETRDLFYRAQEAVNDVLSTMHLSRIAE